MSFIKYNSAQCETTIKEIDSLNIEFDALKGFREAIKEKEKIIENRKELLDDMINEINISLKNLLTILRCFWTHQLRWLCL